MTARGWWGAASSTASGLTLRIGGVFLGLTTMIALLAVATPHLEPGTARLPWLVAIAAAALSGLTCLRVGRVPARIESELIRTGSDERAWQTIRPLVGQGRAVQAWNGLIEQAHGRNRGDDERRSASPEDPQTALLARAMRSVAAGIAVTGDDFRITAANAPFAALLGLDDPAAALDRNLLDLLRQLTVPTAPTAGPKGGAKETAKDAPQNKQDSPGSAGSPGSVGSPGSGTLDEATAAAFARLTSGASAVTVRLERSAAGSADPLAQPPLESVWRVSRTRLGGRHDDAGGFVWLVQDVTQQALATAARDQFLQTAAHELRTPLGNLRAYAEALSIEQGVSVEEQKEFCNIINDETTRLSRLVDHLLTVGQMEAGSLVVQQHVVEPARVIEEAVDYLRPQVEAGQLTLETEISPKLRSLRGDKDKLQALLVNLIGNAVKYTPAGGHVWVRAAVREDQLEIVVQDDGIGISAEDLPRVFEKFFRAEQSSVQEQRGNGLGLAFAREVARLHHGDITAESTPGEGSTFTLRLPAPDEPSRV
ncbi:PAS domain-containing sensor histidine kinase [Candidatus Laterigemmans baculatus]|uniref:PAS domain-containing sensor histidine kinase n=1 Tax=Candidatus Laterigemmans baculatus TaxID=2770505 RepID=UPI0013D92920|nr:PAS domain-containing sensor histidine kinase [Candidatus Laterigemmans baculatus]